uniref:Phosphofructokinase domain-containing protein n=1 Tax=Timema tahoe TaxID=61484 RepID=A0A7R9P1L6_9NEOP|nr:unnamed protein product [Timema tahoe]
MGGYCGYLATVSAYYCLRSLAGGADAAYIYEEKFSIKDLQQDVYHMASKMAEGMKNAMTTITRSLSTDCTQKKEKGYLVPVVMFLRQLGWGAKERENEKPECKHVCLDSDHRLLVAEIA